ncbi:MBL fold metallo-hydrolase [Alkalibacterium olivapovliticus]|uniref:Glyoxylase-like metal-dependent hydrolase (Beta-lactamase superfamily II) n=1 Tax=Alkalibacterium olivapovliticus TaxID=99907 RepID=A0A2T0W8I0_9LACT|nr:MBL fold metallo-hydrolase [Alkalibacterium olivapovliticus]PRY82956.1 glyoxylase-like metal-dependent hydrolase (beta-lactamase superfamily II) [Alkalibacterium olivapovliticus]
MLHFQKGNLTVFQSALYKTTTAIIDTKQAMIMTDPNWLPEEIEEIRHYIDERLGERKLYIIFTHSDFDHVIGAGAFPEAFVIASKAFHQDRHKKQSIKDMYAFDEKHYIERSYTHSYPTVDRLITMDGDKLKLGEVTLRFFMAPGHTDDGLLTVIEPYGILLSGDYLSDVEFPFIYSNYKDYVKTIEKTESIFNDFEVHCHVPGHGNATDSGDEIKERIAFSKYYLHQLRLNNKELEEECRRRFPFFEGMRETHLGNLEKAKLRK